MDEGAAFREVDDAITTLLAHLVRAVASMFSAFVVARGVAVVVGIPDDQLVAQGLLFAPFGAVAIFLASALPIRKAVKIQRETILVREEQLRKQAGTHQFTAELLDALEMASDERDGLEVVGAALRELLPNPSEVLLADSSRAHMRRAVAHAPGANVAGCGVESPWGCPAVRRGQTLTFSSSDALSACPRLRDRPHLVGPHGATCVPVTVLGTPTGVIHVLTEAHEEIGPDAVDALEGLARHAGSRLGVLRAMASTQLQASTDPLTGLWNRRRLEAEVGRLRDADTDYAIVVADLDNFKRLNDTYGHETGDRALRLFARVMQSVLRDCDVACRFGGEEFVLVLPACTTDDAAGVVGRARLELVALLSNGDVPAFTASFGIADSSQAPDFDQLMRLADEALFFAKQAGRNGFHVAGAPAAQVDGIQDGRRAS